MDKQRSGFTVVPFMVALLIGAFVAPPTDIIKVNARGMGFEHLQPWNNTSQDSLVGRALRGVTLSVQSVLQGLWGHPLRGPALATVVLAVAASYLGADVAAPGMLAVVAGTLTDQRAKLLREAEQLRSADGTFASDQVRASFDAKMAEIEALDGRSEFIAERNPLDPGAPTGGAPAGQRVALAAEEPADSEIGANLERDRITGIMDACRAARIPSSFMDKLIKDKTPLVRAQSAIFDELRKRGGDDRGGAQAGGGAVDVRLGADPMVHVRAGIEGALLHRLAPEHFKLEEVARNYRGMTLLDIGRAYLQAQGVRTTNLSKIELAGSALGLTRASGMHTTSDFADLLADVANKTLRKAYDEQPQTFAPLGRRVTIPDFKLVKRVQLGDAPELLEVNEHGEFKAGTIGEGKEQYQLATYGRKFAITRKALINDDTDAFSRVPMMFGRKARVLESNLAWEQITSNPVMGDSNALFSAAHANDASVLQLATISVAALGVGRATLRNQTSLDGDLMNLTARFLLVPPSLETLADQFVTVISPNQPANTNPFMGKLAVIAEPRLEAISASAWYLAASAEQIDILEFGYLEGQEGPMVESRVGFDVDGVEIKARLDFAAKVIDWRGLYRNEGVGAS